MHELFELFNLHYKKKITQKSFSSLLTKYVATSSVIRSTFIRKENKKGYTNCYNFINIDAPSVNPIDIPISVTNVSPSNTPTESSTPSLEVIDVIIEDQTNLRSQTDHPCIPSTLYRAAPTCLVATDLSNTFHHESSAPTQTVITPQTFSPQTKKYINIAMNLKFDVHPRQDFRSISQSKVTPSTIKQINCVNRVPSDMKWNMISTAIGMGYESLTYKNKLILIEAILLFESYHEGYHRMMGAPTSFLRWYIEYMNKINGADNKQLVCDMYRDKSGTVLYQYSSHPA